MIRIDGWREKGEKVGKEEMTQGGCTYMQVKWQKSSSIVRHISTLLTRLYPYLH